MSDASDAAEAASSAGTDNASNAVGGGSTSDFGGGGLGSEGAGDSGFSPPGIPGAGTGIVDPNQSPAALSSEDLLTKGREIALSGVPFQVSSLFDALAQLRAKASGSTAAILPSIIGQLGALRGQYAQASEALARRLGFAGGGQVRKGQSQLLAQSGQQYARLVGQGQQAGFGGLLNTLGAIQPALSGAARPPNVSTREGTQDFTSAGQSLQALASLARDIRQAQTGSVNVTMPFDQNPYSESEVPPLLLK